LLYDARGSKRRGNTGESGAIIEVVIIAITTAIRTTAVSGIDEGVATITKISVDLIAITVPGVAESSEVASEAREVETSVGNALSNSIGIAVNIVVPAPSGRGASGNRGEVSRVPIVKGVAVLRVGALVSVALANIDKVRSLGRNQKVGLELINETRFVVEEGDASDMRSRLSLLPSIKRGRATTTQAGRLGDTAGTDLVGSAINDVVVVLGIPSEVWLGIKGVLIMVLEVNNAINALGRAGRPLRPSGELAVLLNTLELIGALDARSDSIGANTDLVERSLNKRNSTNVIVGRS